MRRRFSGTGRQTIPNPIANRFKAARGQASLRHPTPSSTILATRSRTRETIKRWLIGTTTWSKIRGAAISRIQLARRVSTSATSFPSISRCIGPTQRGSHAQTAEAPIAAPPMCVTHDWLRSTPGRCRWSCTCMEPMFTQTATDTRRLGGCRQHPMWMASPGQAPWSIVSTVEQTGDMASRASGIGTTSLRPRCGFMTTHWA
mmetsp:Transcript_117102/g.376517  ORF Transcript_117102/g.376517 Transcript_117102/m.376517 type:complete len:202 (-) Transcript_117102:218-823(-)